MSEPSQLIISIQGKRGSGKTTLAARVVAPAMAAIGAKLEKTTDGDKGCFMTFGVPQGFAEQSPLEAFTRQQVDKIVGDALAGDRERGAPRVGFHNADEIVDLLNRRDDLVDYLTGDDDGDVPRKIAQQLLPAKLKKLDPVRVAELLRKDARDAIAAIDAQLEQLGFDTSRKEELPAS